jgi:hypothetical protein
MIKLVLQVVQEKKIKNPIIKQKIKENNLMSINKINHKKIKIIKSKKLFIISYNHK